MRSSEKTNQLEQGGGIDQSCSQSIIENIGLVLDHQLLAHHHHQQQQHAPPQNMQHQASSDPFCGVGAGAAFGGSTSGGRIGGGVGGLMYPEVLPWNLPPTPFNPAAVPQFHTVGRDTTTNTNNNFQHMMDPFLFPQQQQQQQQQQTSSLTSPSPHHYAPHPFFTSRLRPTPNSLQFGGGYDGGSSDHLRILSDALGPMMQHGTGGCSAAPFGLQAELNKLTAQEIMDAKALAASKSHSEAERRRRERINNHLAKLRSLLPSTTKTDKASLLAEVIQHVKELKRQTSQIPDTTMLPTETDELTIDDASHYIDEADDHQYVDGNNNYYNNTNNKKFVIKASLCCDDRSDLLPELIKTLKTLRLKTLKAEITSLGGRVKNVLFITGDQDVNSIHGQGNGGGGDDQFLQYSISSIQEAFKAVMEKSGDHDNGSGGNPKRQRTNNNISILN